MTGTEIILDFFRDELRPVSREGVAIRCVGGRVVRRRDVFPTSTLIGRLAGASDAPQFADGGHAVNREALPGFFTKWARVAWADLLESLPRGDER